MNKSKKIIQELKRRNTSQKTKKRKGITSGLKLLENIKIQKAGDIDKYLPPKNEKMVSPFSWELQNRKAFFQWVMDNFDKYETGNPSKAVIVNKEEISVNPTRKVQQLLPIQKLVRDFMASPSPYRGILLYYGLGVGKTISSIVVAEVMTHQEKIVVLSKTALENNFRKGILEGGRDYMIQNNYWVFIKNTNEHTESLRIKLGIPKSIVDINGGMFLIDFTNPISNYLDLPALQRSKLDNQLSAHINSRFVFYHTDNTRLLKNIKESDFDNKIIIVDEVHNLVNNMTKDKGGGIVLYNIFMNAKNSRFIFLTGTPLINKVFEMSRLFNILRGKIPVIEFKIHSGFGSNIDFKKIKNTILMDNNVDQVIINKISRTVKITKNPDGYITNKGGRKTGGIVYVGIDKTKSFDELLDSLEKSLKIMGHKFGVKTLEETALPEDEQQFNSLFVNMDLNKLKKESLLKKRIAGLTSFYDFKDPARFPKLLSIENIECPMTSYQLGIYERYRNEEITKEINASKKKGGDDDAFHSSYRIQSRFACSFVFPSDMPNKYDMQKIELLQEQMNRLKEEGAIVEDIDTDNEAAVSKFITENLLKSIIKDRTRYLTLPSQNPDGELNTLSPKYAKMLANIQNSEGCILIYSYFMSLIGLNMIAQVLEATGEWEKLQIKKIAGIWHLITNDTEIKGSHNTNTNNNTKTKKGGLKPKKKYLFYSGKETSEEKLIIPLIYNSQFDKLPGNCEPLKASLKKIYGKDENLHGNIIKCLMITQSGAEGLDLKHVRSVHVSEPYWQPVLIEQVIGRAVRTDSHIRLPEDERNVKVFIYMASINKDMVSKISYPAVRRDIAKYNYGLGKKGNVITSDEALFILSEKKKILVTHALKCIKESAFDCSLNYAKNRIQSPNLICLDYDISDRDEYLFTPGLEDTQDIIDTKQEFTLSTPYTKIELKGNIYYVENYPSSNGKYYIYDNTLMTRVRKPVPVGLVIFKDGVKKYGLYPKKK